MSEKSIFWTFFCNAWDSWRPIYMADLENLPVFRKLAVKLINSR